MINNMKKKVIEFGTANIQDVIKWLNKMGYPSLAKALTLAGKSNSKSND